MFYCVRILTLSVINCYITLKIVWVHLHFTSTSTFICTCACTCTFRPTIFQASPFSPYNAIDVMRRYSVTNVAAAPVWYRAIKAKVESENVKLEWPALQRASSAGEPLNPSVATWLLENTENAVPVRDQYGQTEVGMVCCDHWHQDYATETPPYSSGKSMPGYQMAVVDADTGVELPSHTQGALAVDREKSDLFWFRGYLDQEQKTRERFVGGQNGDRYYLTGDVAETDENGFYYFSSRDDDVILSSAYRIGPFEVESAIMQHAAVAEVAVVGIPDPEGLRGDIVKAFVVLKPPGAGPETESSESHAASDTKASAAREEEAEELALIIREVKELVRKVGAHMVPRQVEFVFELPKTPSGKIQRYLLRKDAAA